MRRYHQHHFHDSSIYPVHPWQVEEEELLLEHYHHNETIFSLGNGYLGTRGTLEERYQGPEGISSPGVYINGIYDSEDFIYGEEVPREPETTQSMVCVADWTPVAIQFEGETLNSLQSHLESHSRVLDMARGYTRRRFFWRTEGGALLEIEFCRIVSLMHTRIAALTCRIKVLEGTGSIQVISSLEGRIKNIHTFRDKERMQTVKQGQEGEGFYLLQATRNSPFLVSCAVDHSLQVPQGKSVERNTVTEHGYLARTYSLQLEEGEALTLEKFACYCTNRELAREHMVNRTWEEARERKGQGWQHLLWEQETFLREFWSQADVIVKGDDRIQQGLRFNALHLLMSTGRDGITSIGAKGLTGEFYEGHYFWDVEIYILPFFLHVRPDIARKLLEYRYRILNEARANARRFRSSGALYSWRTINGHEASGYFMGSSVQCHINADIVYALKQYVEVTGDKEFLHDYGAEIVFETARFWRDRGNYIQRKGNQFCMNVVCGPDEYKPGVNNNCYTNYMARFNLQYGVEVAGAMAQEAPDTLKELQKKLHLTRGEIESWQEAAEAMYLPYDKELGFHPQDDTFLDLAPMDVDDLPAEDIPLVRNWHPLVIWRYQLIKQADVLLLMFLLGDLFRAEEKKKNYEYYEPKTTHDSSLSPAIHGIVACEIGALDQAYSYCTQTVRIDLDDYNNNAYQGIHAACMGGAWMGMVYGFAGMRCNEEGISFSPILPSQWEGYSFKVMFRNQQIEITVDEMSCSYTLLEGTELRIAHGEESVLLKKGQTIHCNRKQ